jgi:hypothetical protein
MYQCRNCQPVPKLPDLTVQFMHDFLYDFLPVSFSGTWVSKRSIREIGQNQIELRDSDRLFIPYARTCSYSLKPLHRFPVLWENFPRGDIKFIRNKPEFNFE